MIIVENQGKNSLSMSSDTENDDLMNELLINVHIMCSFLKLKIFIDIMFV